MVAETLAYARTRLLRWRLGGLWALLLVALATGGAIASLASLVWQAVFLALAIAALRLWDDLADLDHDRAEHPERVLVRSTHLSLFVALAAAGLLLLALVLLDERQRLAIYAVLLVGLGLLYHTALAGVLPRALRGYLLLSKYPVLLFLAGAQPSSRAWLTALCVYVAVAVYEWRDDSAVRAAPLYQVSLGGAAALVLISALFLTGGNAQ